jgi:hypothetical protein
MTGKFSLVVILLAGLFLFSCRINGSDQPDAVDVEAIRTQAVSTFASSLTETMAPKPTASATLTSLPTFTPSTVTSTPSPTATQNPCYNLIWLEDRSIPDGTQMRANEVFTKTWLVQNNGGCAWAPGFTFSHVGGDPMRGKTLVLDQPIPVGAKRELSVELIVPGGQTGLIQSSWRMADAQGFFFGDTLSVNINVGTITTPTVTNTP